jgi:hypothetical protein
VSVRLYRWQPRGVSFTGRWYESSAAALACARFLVDADLVAIELAPSVASACVDAPVSGEHSGASYYLPRGVVRLVRLVRNHDN